jgi:hypothetical protein
VTVSDSFISEDRGEGLSQLEGWVRLTGVLGFGAKNSFSFSIFRIASLYL